MYYTYLNATNYKLYISILLFWFMILYDRYLKPAPKVQHIISSSSSSFSFSSSLIISWQPELSLLSFHYSSPLLSSEESLQSEVEFDLFLHCMMKLWLYLVGFCAMISICKYFSLLINFSKMLCLLQKDQLYFVQL